MNNISGHRISLVGLKIFRKERLVERSNNNYKLIALIFDPFYYLMQLKIFETD